MSSTILYYQPHQSRKSEAAFFEALQQFHPEAILSYTHFEVPQEKMDQFLEVKKLVLWLQKEQKLPLKKRNECLVILKNFPSKQLRIAFTPKEISFDIVLVKDHKIHYWEFQEKQHAKLTVDRLKKVYTPDGKPVEVPRFFQRLMRDLWRLSFFRPYTSVWKDWFESEARTDQCLEIAEGYREYHLPGKFSFKGFLERKLLFGEEGT